MNSASLKGALVGGIAGAVMAVGTVAVAGTGVGGVFNLGEPNDVDATSKLSGITKGPQLYVTNGDAGQPAVKGESKTGTGVWGVSSTGTGVSGESDSNIAGSFTSTKFVGVRATGVQRGLEASNTAGGQPAAWAHHDGTNPGYGLTAQSANGPAARLLSSAGQPPMLVNSTAKVTSLNADMVDGLHASLQGGPNKLVATGAAGKLPVDVIPPTTFGLERYVDRCSSGGCSNNLLPQTLSLPVGPGSYLVMGKFTGWGVTNQRATIECRTSAGSDFDISRGSLGLGAGATFYGTIPTFLLHTFSSGGTITLSCTELDVDAGAAFNMKLIAIKLDGETHSAAP